MKFGKLEHIEGIDFSLPANGEVTKQLFKQLEPNNGPKFYTGGTQFGRPEWIGEWFPAKTKSTDFLIHYQRMFNTIELNATHYRVFPHKTVKGWADKVNDEFRFCPKWPQTVSHRRRFQNSQDITDDFLASIFTLENKLGPCFIQLPPNFTAQKAEQLFHYLHDLPRDLRLTVEFRHESWFEAENQSFFEELLNLEVGACMSDTAGRRDAVHMQLTAPFVLMRFGGYELHPTDYARIDEWNERFKTWTDQGIKEVYVLLHQPDSIKTPETLIHWNQLINKQFNQQLPIPSRVSEQGSLF